MDSFNDVGLNQLVNGVTHEKGRTLDLILSNSMNNSLDINILNKNSVCSSDHYAIQFNLNVKSKRKINPKRKIFNFKKAKWQKLNENILFLNNYFPD